MDYAAVASDAGSLVPVYDIVHTPLRIYNARGTAWNHHLRWEAARVKAQDVQDILVVPLVGGAISIAATGLASAGATAVAAAGLGGGSLEAGYSYAHPDQDAATDQVAVTELLCIVDLTEPLLSMSVVQLALDKAALRDAVDKMTIDAADVLASDDPKDQAVKASVTQAKTLAESKIAALNTELSAYVSLPSVIRSATDAADNKAKDGGKRSFDYAGVLADLQKAASTQAATMAAKASAAPAAPQSAAPPPKTKTATKVTSAPAPSGKDTTLQSVTGEATTVAAHAQDLVKTTLAPANQDLGTSPSATAPRQQGVPIVSNGSTKSEILSSLFKATNNDITRVNVLADVAADDLPSPSFAIIATTIKGCSVGSTATGSGLPAAQQAAVVPGT